MNDHLESLLVKHYSEQTVQTRRTQLTFFVEWLRERGIDDMTALREHVHLNETALNQIKTFAHPKKGHSAEFLIAIGEKAESIRNSYPCSIACISSR